MPGTHDTILAFDYGRRRIGIAVGQQVTGSANPLSVVRNTELGPDWREIDKIVQEWQPACLVVGMPSNVDGSRSQIAIHVDEFIDELGRFQKPVHTVDERYTSLEAEEMLKSERAMGLRGRIRKEMIDSVAAVLIAERWLRKETRSG
jgi:putative Holliday junction resolvase